MPGYRTPGWAALARRHQTDNLHCGILINVTRRHQRQPKILPSTRTTCCQDASARLDVTCKTSYEGHLMIPSRNIPRIFWRPIRPKNKELTMWIWARHGSQKLPLRWGWVFFKSRLQNDVHRFGCDLAGLFSQQILLNLIKRCRYSHSGTHVTPRSWRSSDRIPWEPDSMLSCAHFCLLIFLGNPNIMFWPKNQEISQKYSWSYVIHH